MTTQLLNERGKKIPPRPTLNQNTINTAVKKCVNKCQTLQGLESKELAKFALHIDEFWESDKDAYQIAKEMESVGFVVDAQFVNDIIAISLEVKRTQFNNELDWHRTYLPQPPLMMGQSFQLDVEGKLETLVIESVYHMLPASYVALIVSSDTPDDRVWISFESALTGYLGTLKGYIEAITTQLDTNNE